MSKNEGAGGGCWLKKEKGGGRRKNKVEGGEGEVEGRGHRVR